MTYNPSSYWEKRLSRKFALSGVGNISFSERYNRWGYKAKARKLEDVLSYNCIEVKGKSVCDIGCGTGFYTDFYLRRGAEDIVGIDITSVSVENLKKKYPNCSFVQDSIASSGILNKINRKFDIVNIFDVLYHITDDAAFKQALSNICDLAKQNGFIVFTDTWTGDRHFSEHVKKRDREGYEAAFRDGGVEILGVYPLFRLLNWPIFPRLPHFNYIIDNTLAPLYYYLDMTSLPLRKSNLDLIIARKSDT